MNRLSLEQVLKDNNTRDPNSISSLKLNHKALSDVRRRFSALPLSFFLFFGLLYNFLYR